MKSPKLKIRKKIRIKAIRRFKQGIKEIVHDCLLDIEWYIVDDIMRYLRKQGILYEKTTKTNKTSKKKKK